MSLLAVSRVILIVNLDDSEDISKVSPNKK